MSARDERDEITPNGTVILWSQRADHKRSTPVWVRYPCCGQELETPIWSLDRYRSGRVQRCEDCKGTPTPVMGTRPTCPQCGRRPVMQQYSGAKNSPRIVTSYAKLCYTCKNS